MRHDFLIATGQAIVRLRKARGLSQGELAAAADLKQCYLARVEGGYQNAAQLTLLRIAMALEVQVADLHAGYRHEVGAEALAALPRSRRRRAGQTPASRPVGAE